MLNRQDRIKEYHEYDFTTEEIVEELNLEVWFVEEALKPSSVPRTEQPARSRLRIYKGKGGGRSHPRDRTIPSYELLYKYGPNRLNTYLKKYGLVPAGRVLGIPWQWLYTLKVYFGYHNKLPRDALDRITYFSEEIRRQVDDRDKRVCIRCGSATTTDSIRYHKINHPAPMTADNCATLCDKCRIRAYKYYAGKQSIFKGYGVEGFREWVVENDPLK